MVLTRRQHKTAHNSNSPFFLLPAEVRHRIYHFLMPHHVYVHLNRQAPPIFNTIFFHDCDPECRQESFDLETALVYACRATHIEYTQVLYSRCIFHSIGTSRLDAWLQTGRKSNVASITTMSVDLFYSRSYMVKPTLKMLMQLSGIKVLELRAFGPAPWAKGLWGWHDLRRAAALLQHLPKLQSVYSFLLTTVWRDRYVRFTHSNYTPKAKVCMLEVEIRGS